MTRPARLSARETTKALLHSILLGGALTSYADHYEQKLLIPLRNLVVLGRWKVHSSQEIGPTRYRHGESINPVHVAQLVRSTALHILGSDAPEPAPSSQEERRRLVEVAEFFLETGETHEFRGQEYLVWTYDFDYPRYRLRGPWVSGMAQGHVIEAMLAAHRLTGTATYLTAARLAGNAMGVPVEHGGVMVQLEDGIWFEEYARAGTVSPRVLNGHISALEGLRCLCAQDASYRDLYAKGLQGLRALLPRFDAGVWSRYDLVGTPADPKYQRIHIHQWRKLAALTGDALFSRYSRRFQLQLLLPLSAFYRIATFPNGFLCFTFLANTLLFLAARLGLYRWLLGRLNASEICD